MCEGRHNTAMHLASPPNSPRLSVLLVPFPPVHLRPSFPTHRQTLSACG